MAKFSFSGEVLSGKEEFFQKIRTALEEGHTVHFKKILGDKKNPLEDFYLLPGESPESKIKIAFCHHHCASIRT